jgi:ribosome-interacting GTPase 1
MIIIVLDATKPVTHKKLIEHELEGFGIRLNKKMPAIDFRRKEKGGITISRTVDCELDDDLVHILDKGDFTRIQNIIGRRSTQV